jgi:hypothetical protein
LIDISSPVECELKARFTLSAFILPVSISVSTLGCSPLDVRFSQSVALTTALRQAAVENIQLSLDDEKQAAYAKLLGTNFEHFS